MIYPHFNTPLLFFCFVEEIKMEYINTMSLSLQHKVCRRNRQ